ncbi:MAG: leucyl/phenylalanyl-tRNA--protein transferase [Gammaproteobacteria bacterium]
MLTLLDPENPNQPFPPVKKALTEPNGLLAIGGCLSTLRLLNAYREGIFPWFNRGEPLLWWSPNPRLVIFPEKIKIAKSLKKTIKKKIFNLTFDKAFSDVVHACSLPRVKEKNTWISPEIEGAYNSLYSQGVAHSVETWHNQKLVGGLYGVAIGRVFFGESMFHLQTDASKIAFVELVKNLDRWGYRLIDCQVRTQHLISLGAEEIPRSRFIRLLQEYCNQTPDSSAWKN